MQSGRNQNVFANLVDRRIWLIQSTRTFSVLDIPYSMGDVTYNI